MRHHDGVRPPVQRPTDEPGVMGRDAYDQRGLAPPGRAEIGQQLRLGEAAVLHVEQQPVKAALGRQLGDHG